MVLDPHPLWIEAVGSVLASLGIGIAGKAGTAAEALELVEAHRPDILLVETALESEMNGSTVVRAAKQLVPTLRVIALSSSCEPAEIDAAFEAGVLAYVVKTAQPDDVAATIRQAFDHSIFLAPVQAVGAVPIRRERTVDADEASSLTRREREILALVAEGHSNRELARMLWVTEQTVKFHLSNIYRKLSVSNRTEASRWAHKHRLLGAAEAIPA